jgi:hypothetical protein
MPIFMCPRCRGNDFYYAERQEVKTTDGSYPTQYVANVQRAFCRQCAEPMINKGPTPEEVAAERNARQQEAAIKDAMLGFGHGCLPIFFALIFLSMISFFVADYFSYWLLIVLVPVSFFLLFVIFFAAHRARTVGFFRDSGE